MAISWPCWSWYPSWICWSSYCYVKIWSCTWTEARQAPVSGFPCPQTHSVRHHVVAWRTEWTERQDDFRTQDLWYRICYGTNLTSNHNPVLLYWVAIIFTLEKNRGCSNYDKDFRLEAWVLVSDWQMRKSVNDFVVQSCCSPCFQQLQNPLQPKLLLSNFKDWIQEM